MTWLRPFIASAATSAGIALILTGCGGDGTGPDPLPTIQCTSQSTQSLAVGQYRIIDPNVSGSCVRLPAAGAGGAEHLYVALAAEGDETLNGVEAPYALKGPEGMTARGGALRNGRLSRSGKPNAAEAFHHTLRARERALSESPAAALSRARGPAAAVAAVAPTVGDQRTFWVCTTTKCDNFVETTATARHVADKVAIYVDNGAPAGGYTDADLAQVGTLFDNYLYPIDTTAFGRESDIDDNGVVVVLLTQRVNQLSGNCNSTGSVILGYFFGLDLLPSDPHSNDGEVFYGLVPDPTNLSCTITEAYANDNLPPVFIHEFQHMISFNQHVLVRSGSSEDTWLNEGLSHFAEELAGRAIPDALCTDNDCLTQFAAGNLDNAYSYLQNVEAYYLIEPGTSTGTLEERGANWLFVRWLGDHFGTGVTATNLTRSLVETRRLGAANVEAVTGQNFATLVSEWQLANYLEGLASFSGSSPRLLYTSWNLRTTFASFNQQNPGRYPDPYPLIPDSALTAAYSRSGTLRAGSGPHVLVVQGASAPETELTLTAADGTSLPPTDIAPRIALVRIR